MSGDISLSSRERAVEAQSLRKTVPATLLSMCRQGIFFIPTLYIAPLLLGLQGVEMTQAIADVLTFILAIPMSAKILKNLSE
mgnify:CR=1 FL=1